MSSKITIIVNTYDKFEDCWDPFFILFSKFWPTCNYTIVLTTYNKQYEFRNLNIISTQVENHFNYEPAWSETLMFTLEKYVKSDLVLLLLDDFFISNNVDEITIKKCIEIMTEKNYSNITLTNHDSSRISHRTDCSLLNKIDDKSPYRITTSPSLCKMNL